VTLQKTAEEVASHLRKSGLKALAYHAGLPDEQRHEAQDAFMGGRVDTIVATIAFGMGIDKADIRGVYHYNLPKTLENYAQETGRAGRDGRPAVCELLACTDDRIVLDNFTYGDTPTPQAIRHLLDELLAPGASAAASKDGEFDISLYDLAQATDIRPLVIETVLTHLELAGVLRPLGSFYASYQFRLLESEAAVLAGHTPDRQAFLKRLLHAGKRGTKWTTLHPDEAATEMGERRDRILKALNWLADSGHIELKPSGSRQRYRLEGDPATRDPKQLTKSMEDSLQESLQELFADRERRDLERLQGVLDFAAHRGCLTRRLLQYFGEESGDEAVGACGTCTSCQEGVPAAAESGGVAPREIPASAALPISSEQAASVRSLVAEGRPSLRTPRQLARFLCGLTSPATTRERLGKHAAFGLLARVPFADVLSEAETLLG
jgi:ATP-dependent DNA helicase RecQ